MASGGTAHRIEVQPTVPDARANVRKRHLENLGFSGIGDLAINDVYTIEGSLSPTALAAAAEMLTNPVSEQHAINDPLPPEHFDWAIEIGFLPGVTDNVGHTARESLEDRLGDRTILNAPIVSNVYTSQITFLQGEISEGDAYRIANALANPLVQRIHVKSRAQFERDEGMDAIAPRVRLPRPLLGDFVPLSRMDDAQLAVVGREGIRVTEGAPHGPLALDLTYMRAIQSYFERLGREPTDLELESIAQTWSEHCKHTIFADPIDDIAEGLYRRYIKGATNEIRRRRGANDFCVSVFTDNAGAITFDDEYLITDKVETHNTPSALDPFGGAITGIVGVNRDAIGFGLGAKPVANRYGFCFADPDDEMPLYKGTNREFRMLSPRVVLEGVVRGVNAGGNQSGIPTPQGFVYFDERYKGKPLVFVGTLGLIPREVNGKPSHLKKAEPGDYIVMVGGRVGKDGIHGATFSSEILNPNSPATAVQIGDPITQKKLSDALVKEARDLGLYRSITDNGAGGLSCSVAEMARESGGFHVVLERVPVKYEGLAPWEVWISESQERMTLAVPQEKWHEFSALMQRRGVEATVIGEFTDSGKCLVEYHGRKVMDIDMDFLHDGLPPRPMGTALVQPRHEEPQLPALEDLTCTLHAMLARPNIASFAFIAEQYDHEVQAGSVIKPLQGRGRVNGDATVTRPLLTSSKAVVLSQGITPSYGDVDTYHMAACAIDTAIRNAVAAGASLEKLALLDNFCWCSSNEPERLGQLKRAVEACYDVAVGFETPFISGKDSMFNDFKGYDESNNPVKISIPPTLLVSAVGVIDSAEQAISMDAKMPGDLIYVLGQTHDELGGSEYFAQLGEETRGEAYVGNGVPRVRVETNREVYRALEHAGRGGLVASAQGVGRGGLAIALAKTAMAGELGMELSLDELAGSASRDELALYSESQGRIVVTVAPQNRERFEATMRGVPCSLLGTVSADRSFTITSAEKVIVSTDIDSMLASYRATFEGF